MDPVAIKEFFYRPISYQLLEIAMKVFFMNNGLVYPSLFLSLCVFICPALSLFVNDFLPMDSLPFLNCKINDLSFIIYQGYTLCKILKGLKNASFWAIN